MTPEEMIIAQKELSNKLKENELLKNADDYAIEFGKWILKQCISPSLDDLYVDDKGDLISDKQLLQIFKKEKGYDTNN